MKEAPNSLLKPSTLKISDPDTISGEILPEYRFDYRKAKPNRFAPREDAIDDAIEDAIKTVKLDADVAAVFTTDEAVNTILRALIQSMPPAVHRETVS
jgi:hypothetical protein